MWMVYNIYSYMDVTAHWLDDNIGTHNKCLVVHPAPAATMPNSVDVISQQYYEKV